MAFFRSFGPSIQDQGRWQDAPVSTRLTARHEKGSEMSVVAGIDQSPVSRLVVARALEQASWRGTDLHLVHVFYQPMVYTEAAINWGEVAASQRAGVWQSVDDLLVDIDVGVKRVDLEGYPPEALVTYATDGHAELVVVGTRGRGELASLVLGSTSHRAIQLAECDVLVVKGGET
jgi:nucleotide-binding universal stress UspA family protein